MHLNSGVPVEARGVDFPEGVMDTSCGCWDWTMGPLQETRMLLTPEQPLQPRSFLFKWPLHFDGTLEAAEREEVGLFS